MAPGRLDSMGSTIGVKYRPRICELSKCLEGALKMIVCPKKLLPTLSHLIEIAVCRSTIMPDRTAGGAPRGYVCGGHQHCETESGSSLKMTRLQSVTLQVARGRQKSSRPCL
ncbi:hypothetical protein TNCV_3800001 [Trichonephila clavipes]|nr:hypothetical protein TNCV_3800001 [Trichonephila clavipes]